VKKAILSKETSISLESKGIISKKPIKASIIRNTDKGIRFFIEKPEASRGEAIEAKISNLGSTQRNTVLSKGDQIVCLTEHFLAACSLMNVQNIDVILNENELPFGDGSAKLWVDFFKENNIGEKISQSKKVLAEEIIVKDPNDESRFIKAVPCDNFKATYLMDWDHPKIGKQEYTWSLNDELSELAHARTFSSEEENKIFGLDGWVVGLSKDDFTKPLLFKNEPARHKVLDLVGDLSLSGTNPLNIKMHVSSSKGGHWLNSELTKKLANIFTCLLISLFTLMTSVKAEEYRLELKGTELSNVAAMEITMGFNPEDSFSLDDYFYVSSRKPLFKTLDKKRDIIRVFFREKLRNNILIVGNLNRGNYTGTPNVSIKEMNFISKLGTNVNPENIKVTFKLIKKDEVLPFRGIVKGKILGPHERIFQRKMLIALSNIETYGFEFNKSLKSVKINGEKAKFLNDDMVFATLSFPEDGYKEELDIKLEVKVQDKIIKKKIGTIKLLESV